jgi:hypothetical protein
VRLFLLNIMTFVLLSSLPVNASEDVCMPKKQYGQDVDICEYLKGMQRKLVDSLPMKVSKNITIINAVAIKNLMMLTAIASYDKAHLIKIGQSVNMSEEEMLSKHREATLNMVCTNEVYSAVLYFGAEVHYNFQYNDGTSMTTVKIKENSC